MADASPTVDMFAESHRRSHYLRVVLSGFFGVMTVIMVGLWVRSYSRMDVIAMPNWNWGAGGFFLISHRGTFGCIGVAVTSRLSEAESARG